MADTCEELANDILAEYNTSIVTNFIERLCRNVDDMKFDVWVPTEADPYPPQMLWRIYRIFLRLGLDIPDLQLRSKCKNAFRVFREKGFATPRPKYPSPSVFIDAFSVSN